GEDRGDGGCGAGEVHLGRRVAVDEDLGGATGRRQGGVQRDEGAGERDRGGVAAGAVAGDRAAVVVRQARRRLHPARGRGGVDDLRNAAGVVGVVVVDDRQRVGADGERERRGGSQARVGGGEGVGPRCEEDQVVETGDAVHRRGGGGGTAAEERAAAERQRHGGRVARGDVPEAVFERHGHRGVDRLAGVGVVRLL